MGAGPHFLVRADGESAAYATAVSAFDEVTEESGQIEHGYNIER
jgi:hypothetical protein